MWRDYLVRCVNITKTALPAQMMLAAGERVPGSLLAGQPGSQLQARPALSDLHEIHEAQ